MHRVERPRKSAKGTIANFADELLARRNDPEVRTKLLVIETIAFRMNWLDLYEKLRFKSGLHTFEGLRTCYVTDDETPEPEEKWFQR